MKGRVLLIDRGSAALLIDGRLEDLLLEEASAPPAPGDIYRARVDRLMPNMGGAFLRLGADLQGYLREAKGVKPGQDLLVQVTGYAEPGKALPVARRPLLKSRGVILTPGAPGVNMSRAIKDLEQRERLGQVAWETAEIGLILRSAARVAAPEALSAEAAGLLAEWRRIEAGGEGRLWHLTGAETALNEWTDPVPDAIHAYGLPVQVSDKYGELADHLTQAEPDPFDRFGVWEAVAGLRRAEAALPSGGSMIVEPTRALVAVDVNAADGSAMTTNVEAARELPRQLRLRGLGGQIVVDFAPLKKMHRKKIEEVLKAALRRDPVETQLVGWTPLGHLELNRKRERRPLSRECVA
ncbi:MAG: ribonuclease E/G [Pseudomonadota bacterium]